VADWLTKCLQHEWPQQLTSENVVESASELKEFATIDDIIKLLEIEVCIFFTSQCQSVCAQLGNIL